MQNELQESELKSYEIPLSEIYSDNDFNCRGSIAPIDVLDLSRSIEEHGLQQAIVIQPWNKTPGKKWRIVSGHRRHMAFVILKKKTIPAVIKENLTELEAKKFNLIENIKRKDLNILQEAQALAEFWKEKWTQDMVKDELGQSRGWVQARHNLLHLPEEIQQEAAAGFLTQDHIKQLYSIKSKQLQFEAVKKIKNAKLLGEKKSFIRATPKKQNPLKKRVRTPQEIFAMQDIIQQAVGNNFGTFCLGWASGHNSDYEMYKELQEVAESLGKCYVIPNEIIDQVTF